MVPGVDPGVDITLDGNKANPCLHQAARQEHTLPYPVAAVGIAKGGGLF